MHVHIKCDDYREYSKHNNEACKHPRNNLTALIYSLAKGFFTITTESIKLILDVEQFGTSSHLIISTENFIFFFYASSLKHSMDSTELPLSFYQPTMHYKV